MEKVIAALAKAQQEHASAALASPQERTEFEYGRVCGIHAGLGEAWRIIIETLRDDKDHDDSL